MTEPAVEFWTASDGYPIHVTSWSGAVPVAGSVVLIHGVQSHAGWYHNLGQTLANRGLDVYFPDRRGSGANARDRGHAPSARRLVDDIIELIIHIKSRSNLPLGLGGISWGGKLAVVAAGERPDLVAALALVCPGLQPRVGVSTREKIGIGWAMLTNRRKLFPVPLADPGLFTDSPRGKAFIAADPLSVREATASLLFASTIIDRMVKRNLSRVRPPVLLMLAGHDRIVDNEATKACFDRIASADKQLIEYPGGHHTLEFDPDPTRYANDLADWFRAKLQSGTGAGANKESLQ